MKRGTEGGVTAVLADLEEAMSGVSLSQPEGRALRDVHVRCFHHTLIDPGDRKQLIRWCGEPPLLSLFPPGVEPLSLTTNT